MLRISHFSDQILAATSVGTATAMESSATVEPAAAKSAARSASRHCRSGVESSALGSASGINAARITAAGCIVRTRSPGPNVPRIKRMIKMSTVERSPIDQPR